MGCVGGWSVLCCRHGGKRMLSDCYRRERPPLVVREAGCPPRALGGGGGELKFISINN